MAAEPILLEQLVAPQRRRRFSMPTWIVLLLRNPKSRLGLVIVAFMVVVALIAPLISVAHPNDFNLLAARQAPSWHHLFGTTDQGSDIFSQVVVGARRSLVLGAAAGVQLAVPVERVPARAAAGARDRARVRRRLGAEHAHRDDQHHR